MYVHCLCACSCCKATIMIAKLKASVEEAVKFAFEKIDKNMFKVFKMNLYLYYNNTLSISTNLAVILIFFHLCTVYSHCSVSQYRPKRLACS